MMKKLILTLTIIFISFFVCQITIAQDLSNSEVRKKMRIRPPREIRREARNYDRQGYKVAVGATSVEQQLMDAWLKQQEIDDNGFPKYIISSASSVGETQIAAKLQATEAAKLDLAGQISTNIAALIENNFANSQLNTEEATSVTKTVAASKSLIAQQLGRVLPIVELYRNIGQNIEANIRLAYSSSMAMETAKNAIRKSLEEETDIVKEKLESLMKF